MGDMMRQIRQLQECDKNTDNHKTQTKPIIMEKTLNTQDMMMKTSRTQNMMKTTYP